MTYEELTNTENLMLCTMAYRPKHARNPFRWLLLDPSYMAILKLSHLGLIRNCGFLKWVATEDGTKMAGAFWRAPRPGHYPG